MSSAIPFMHSLDLPSPRQWHAPQKPSPASAEKCVVHYLDKIGNVTKIKILPAEPGLPALHFMRAIDNVLVKGDELLLAIMFWPNRILGNPDRERGYNFAREEFLQFPQVENFRNSLIDLRPTRGNFFQRLAIDQSDSEEP
jgi:hypothetical protein